MSTGSKSRCTRRDAVGRLIVHGVRRSVVRRGGEGGLSMAPESARSRPRFSDRVENWPPRVMQGTPIALLRRARVARAKTVRQGERSTQRTTRVPGLVATDRRLVAPPAERGAPTGLRYLS